MLTESAFVRIHIYTLCISIHASLLLSSIDIIIPIHPLYQLTNNPSLTLLPSFLPSFLPLSLLPESLGSYSYGKLSVPPSTYTHAKIQTRCRNNNTRTPIPRLGGVLPNPFHSNPSQRSSTQLSISHPVHRPPYPSQRHAYYYRRSIRKPLPRQLPTDVKRPPWQIACLLAYSRSR